MNRQNAAGKGKKRAGLTAGSETIGGAPLTPPEGLQLTPERRTRRYKPRARKCALKTCGTVFTPAAKHGRFCSDICRKANARRKVKPVQAKPVKRDLELAKCAWCSGSFLPEQGRGAKYCGNSHKELAYRQRRTSAVEALAVDMGATVQEAANLLDTMGMSVIGLYLRQRGYAYYDAGRAWLMAVAVGAFVEQGVRG